jgi:hypothetical protein
MKNYSADIYADILFIETQGGKAGHYH